MIYFYEAAILRYINSIIPEIRMMIYSKQSDLFTAMNKVTVFPAFFYYRVPVDWSHMKEYYVQQGDTAGNYVPFEQTYIGQIQVENQKDAILVAEKLRFAMAKKPYLFLKYPTPDYSLRVALRFLYIKIDELRSSDDTKGALRYVEFSWKSQLFMEQYFGTSQEFPYSLVEQVKIFLSEDNSTVNVQLNDDLIKVIN